MKTKVIFRMLQGECLALFPREAADLQPYANCLSYAHLGQHGAASLTLARASRPATVAEYKELAAELRRIGYKLDLRHRTGAADTAARVAQVESVRG